MLTKGWIECAGIADRCDHDLRQHAESGENFSIEKNPSIDQLVQRLKELGHCLEENEETVGRIQKFIQNDNAKWVKF